MSNRLELDTSVLREKEQNYTSLTDLNHLGLFTDDFETVMRKEKKIEEDIDKSLRNMCFTGDFEKEEKDEIVSDMFQTSQRIVVEDTNQSGKSANYFIFLGSILMGLIMCILVFEITNRRVARKNDDNIDDKAE